MTRCSSICVDKCKFQDFERTSKSGGKSCYLTCSRGCFERCVKSGFELPDPSVPCDSPECENAHLLDPERALSTKLVQEERMLSSLGGNTISLVATESGGKVLHQLAASKQALLPADDVLKGSQSVNSAPSKAQGQALTKLEQRAVDELQALVVDRKHS